MKTLLLASGPMVALVDDEDHERLSAYHWIPFRSRGIWYAARMVGRCKKVFLHHEVMPPPPDLICDHINGNGLDNRRENLRLCTQAQNVYNRGRRKKSRRRFVGVQPSRGKWYATIGHMNKMVYLGMFSNEVEAAKAYDAAALRLRGEFARLNFPDAERIARGQSPLALTVTTDEERK